MILVGLSMLTGLLYGPDKCHKRPVNWQNCLVVLIHSKRLPCGFLLTCTADQTSLDTVWMLAVRQ